MTDYNKDAVEKAIQKDKTISKKEAKLIHALLKGHQKWKKYLKLDLAPINRVKIGAKD